MATKTGTRAFGLLVSCMLLLVLMGGLFYWQAVGSDMSNPRADFWRVVRQGVAGYSSTPQQGHTILMTGGENWREIRNAFVMPYSQWILILAIIGILALYAIAGPDRLEKPRSGIKLERYPRPDRILHWYTAVLFIAMALTGLSILLGRIVLIPAIGLSANSGWLKLSKELHNYCGPLLLIGILLEIIFWVKFNIPEKVDIEWIRKVTGILKNAKPHIGRVNAGQKAWFWLVAAAGVTVGVTGVLLDFPIWGQSRFTMQISHVIHAAVAVPFVGAALGHIYMGSIGVEGVFEGMWDGSVDAVWAEQHSDLWYQEKMREEESKSDRALPEHE